ncbi:MAG: SUMF1/EgtB/PvdO family nonheme iron enzyme [Alphaproteobacteria bacterium]|nr:SUMF1/EgtB/PvdO family nonheme iron enzyme [Alphaproteobacteria bacterium]
MLEDLLASLQEIAARHGLSPEAQEEVVELVMNLMGAGGPNSVTWSGSLDPLWDEPAHTERAESAPNERYDDLGRIALGGMGEIRRARDFQLNRVIAMKVLRPELVQNGQLYRRFFEEAQVTAQLQHPGIVPIHELGEYPDGRPYFTMPEVAGRTLSQIISEVRRLRPDQPATGGGWNLRRLLDAFRKACEAVAFAHARRVIHRDLKPDNIMVGSFGEVLVMDWGLAKLLDDMRPDPVYDDRGPQLSGLAAFPEPATTHAGSVFGTPAYMPPEQAFGTLSELGPQSDVFSLGAILFEILTGRPPYGGGGSRTIVERIRQAPPDLTPLDDPRVPTELAQICRKALARSPVDRPADAGVLAEQLVMWLDGARKREQALELVRQARDLQPQILDLRTRAQVLERQASRLRDRIPATASVAEKRPLWQLEDDVNRLNRDADFKQVERTQLLYSALNHDHDLDEAHTLLAEHYRALHAEAEAQRDSLAAQTLEMRLRAHDRGRHVEYLAGDGALTLYTDPPGAEVTLFRYADRDRRLIPEFERSLGPTPLRRVRLPMGSYLLKINAPGHAEVTYPIHIARQAHWDGVPPGETRPLPIVLPREGELGEDDRYVPAGWFLCGGDAGAPRSLPQRRIWVEPFVIRRFPVTNAEYLAFLNALVDAGREADALRWAARERGAIHGEVGPLAYNRDADGHFGLTEDSDGDVWQPDWPAFMIDWKGAMAYARWSATPAAAWRLPAELEWEKAARGVDGRRHPWGETLDPTFCCIISSHEGRPMAAGVDSYPVDASVYGVRGMAGGVRDWTLDFDQPKLNAAKGPPVIRGRANVRDPDEPVDKVLYAVTRGGSWFSTDRYARLASRHVTPADHQSNAIGFRIARSFRQSR